MIKQHTLSLQGMSCSSCVARVEKALSAVPGLEKAQVNLTTETATFFLPDHIPIASVIKVVTEAGYKASLKNQNPLVHQAQQKIHLQKIFFDFIISAILTTPLLIPMLVMPWYHLMLPSWLQLILAAVVQFIFGARFYKASFQALRAKTTNMDVLVALGTTVAFALSVFEFVFRASTHLYFETSASIITLILMGKWLEARSKNQTTEALSLLYALAPQDAVVLVDGVEKRVPLAEVKKNDLVVVRAGERVSVDGVIQNGSGHLNESSLTGESLPVFKEVGHKVFSGTMNEDGYFVIEVLSVGSQTLLAQIIQLVEMNQMSKAPLQTLVDRVSRVFVPVIVFLAVVTAVFWFIFSADVEVSLLRAVAVLVIACPCALGLATPTALVVGRGLAAKHGILIQNSEVLERAHQLTTIVFDKTGTLTQGAPSYQDCWPAQPHLSKQDLLYVAACLQIGSEHPLAQAITTQAQKMGVVFDQVQSLKVLSGVGIQGDVKGQTYLLASERVLSPLQKQQAAHLVEWQNLGRTVSFLLVQEAGEWVLQGAFAFSDELKEHAKLTVQRLHQQGIKTVLLTGDNAHAAQLIAQSLDIKVWQASVLPIEKSAFIENLKKQGEIVAMVGDGINDAPALAMADIGMAMGTGTDVAIKTASLTLMRGDPLVILDALDISRRTYQKIKQNLFWAFIYNVVGVPLAAFGFLTPTLAAAAMAMSSVSVIMNTLLLKRWSPR